MYSGKELDIFNRVVKVICEKIERKEGKLAPEMVKPESDFIKDLGADSLAVVELLMGVEDEFGLEEIPEADVEKIRTVSDVVEYLSKKIN
jgi:acyl carrier protein